MKKLVWLLILLPALAWGGNFGTSIEGKDANVSFVHTSAIDSAHFVFAYPDTSNWYDSVFTYPVAWGSSKIMNGAGLDLDSVGVHIVKIRYYSGGAVVGHTAGVWLHEADSVYAAITDVNKANFKADVSGLSTFDYTSDAVIVGSANSSSFDSVDFKPDYWSAVASHADSGAIGASPWTVAGVGSVYVFMDSSLMLSTTLTYFYGACDLCYERHFPEDGSASKDSSILINPGLSGSDTLVAKVVFKHSNVVDVADSSYYYLNPWWE